MASDPWTGAISVVALVIAFVSLYWSYRSHHSFPKSALKARVILSSGDGPTTYDYIEILNHGPSDVVLTDIIFATKIPSFFSSSCGYWRISSSCDEVSGGVPVSDKREWARIISPGHICSVKITPGKLTYGLSAKQLSEVQGLGFLDSFDRMHLINKASFCEIIQTKNDSNHRS